MNSKLKGIISGAVGLVLGILLAVLDPEKTMDTYLAIVSLVAAGILLLFCCFLIVKKEPLLLLPLAIAGVLLAIGLAVLNYNEVSYMYLFNTFVPFAFVGIGCAIVVYGIYTAFKFSVPYGAMQITFGGAVTALSLCYIYISEFHRAFWIIIGILIAVAGGLQILVTLFRKQKSK